MSDVIWDLDNAHDSVEVVTAYAYLELQHDGARGAGLSSFVLAVLPFLATTLPCLTATLPSMPTSLACVSETLACMLTLPAVIHENAGVHAGLLPTRCSEFPHRSERDAKDAAGVEAGMDVHGC